MKIYLETAVEADVARVRAGFDEKLFKALKPPGLALKVLRFDGCEVGHKVELELGRFLKQRWTSHITEAQTSPDSWYFVDESQGADLPFFLRTWRHEHRVQARPEGGSLIIDEINYQAPLGFNLLLYTPLYFQFSLRKPVYRRFFALNQTK